MDVRELQGRLEVGQTRRGSEAPETLVPSTLFPLGAPASSIVPPLHTQVERIRSPLQRGWIELIARTEWQWFATFTFQNEIHPETADKSYRYWCRLLDESNGYRRNTRSTHKLRCTWVRGLEWQKRGVLHFHCLIGNLPWAVDSKAARAFWQETWFTMLKLGIARIYPVEEVGGVAGYIAKYCSKGGEIDLSPNLESKPLL